MCHLKLTSQSCLPGLHDRPTSRTLVGGGVRAVDGDVEVTKVLLVRNCADSGHTGNTSQIKKYGLGLRAGRRHTVRPSGAQSP